jgi:hypothetical protein
LAAGTGKVPDGKVCAGTSDADKQPAANKANTVGRKTKQGTAKRDIAQNSNNMRACKRR